MQKHYKLLASGLFFFVSFVTVNKVFATNVVVLVGGSNHMSFVPSAASINVGDTITWLYDIGFHTTTSTDIPAGADSWDAPMQSIGDTYSYVPTVPGTYNYVCIYHQNSGMVGSFVVSSSAANHIIEVDGSDGMSFDPPSLSVPLGDTITFQYQNGFHTTTSVNVPDGADAWDEPMETPADVFTYVPAVEGDYNYVCQYHQSMGMIGAFTITEPLLLKIASFTVAAADSGAMLNWVIASSQDVRQYNIERSSNGMDFKTIYQMKVDIKNTNYHFTDVNWVSGKNYYRLKSVNNNATFDYTKVISVSNKEMDHNVSILKNPVAHTLSLHIAGIKDNIQLQVLDLTGKEMLSRLVPSGYDGQLDIDVERLPAAQYVLKVSGLESSQTLKFIKE
jgi:plastocyanin